MKIRVLVVEDEEDWITIIRGYIAKAENITLAGEVRDEVELMSALQHQPVDIVLLDLYLGSIMGGISLADQIKKVSSAKIIVLTSVKVIQKELLFKDISGFLNKNQMDMLCSTICNVAAGDYPYEKLLQEHKKHLVMAELASLSERERAIMRPWIEGKTMVQIGIEEGVSENTIKHQISSIYKKLGIKDRHGRREQLRERYYDMLKYL